MKISVYAFTLKKIDSIFFCALTVVKTSRNSNIRLWAISEPIVNRP